MISSSSDSLAKEYAMIASNNAPRIPKSSIKTVEPTAMCVNMTYDPGPITQAARSAAGEFLDSVKLQTRRGKEIEENT
jgi:hypothetical protein